MMRRLLAIALLSATALGTVLAPAAIAQDQPQVAHPPAHARVTWEDHFKQANLAHDGHLTLAEAKAGYASVGRSFHAIDVDGKGFVTENDIRAWKALQKASRAHSRDDPLRPRNAFQLNLLPARPMNTDAKQTLHMPGDGRREPRHLDDSE